ncbi:FHA domain-containing protein [Lacrimispora sp.]|uniref:FHA domain-containing protein n=1 Tax=Lacrimispora sp. TaxID=2719234 RepID=UPI0028AFBA7D|nr:FHA domain-containing protein [Lacrimispora sp.]
MESRKKMKIGLDIIILICAIFLIIGLFSKGNDWLWIGVMFFAGLASTVDLLGRIKEKEVREMEQPEGFPGEVKATQLMLLDEHDKPLKSWDLAGKTALIVGKKNEGEDVDVDLEDCEYSAFIDNQHAVLNYCLDSWYLEDLGSQNGVRIRKAEDGICYQVTGRPCRILAGDVIYIASTRLLLT